MKVFGFRCLCLGVIAFSAVSMRAKEIEVTFDAKKYREAKDWHSFIVDLYRALEKTPKREKSDTFLLEILNGNIFATVPEALENNFTGEEEQEAVLSMLGNVSTLNVTVLEFSTQSLETFFKNVKVAHLKGTEKITGKYEKCTLVVEQSFETPPEWCSLIDSLYKRFMPYADDKRVLFGVKFKNSGIFADVPDVDLKNYYTEDGKPTDIIKILSKIWNIRVDAEEFSTSSLRKIFRWAKKLYLPNAKFIFGFSRRISREITRQEANDMLLSQAITPKLSQVIAPKVIQIGNSAFFNFQNLRRFNDFLPFFCADRPTLVCTVLDENYFMQKCAPKNARISPTIIKKVNTRYKNIIEQYAGRSVAIGACAFQRCYSLQHISAHVSYVGSAAFAASGLESVHLLLQKPSTGEAVEFGDDVFFNCFRLKEFFAIQGSEEPYFVDSSLNGFFWNCFALRTVCMPNIYPIKGRENRREYKDPEARLYDESSLTLFTNCFSLELLDIRAFPQPNRRIFPHFLVRVDPEAIKQKLQSEDRDWEGYLSSLLAAYVRPEDMGITIETYPKNIQEYVKLCLEVEVEEEEIDKKKTKDKKPLQLFQCKIEENLRKLKKDIYKRPYCDIRYFYLDRMCPYRRTDNLNTRSLCTFFEVDSLRRHSGRQKLYDVFTPPENVFNVLERFNDAYKHWFIEEKEDKEEKPKNEMLGKKVKRTNFYLHGG